jgi:hypothetical protein
MDFGAAIEKINNDFCNLFYAKYLKGEWGYAAGYRTVPEHIARMRKQLADWQEGYDCDNSLCTESKGEVVFNCCRSGQKAMNYTVLSNCCPPPSTVSPSDGLCYFPGSSIPFTTIPCPYCPTGYTLNGTTGLCEDGSGNTASPGPAGLICTDMNGDGNFGPPNKQCPNLVQNFTVLSTAQLTPPGECVLNAPLQAFGPGCFDRHWWPGNVNEILIASFTR